MSYRSRFPYSPYIAVYIAALAALSISGAAMLRAAESSLSAEMSVDDVGNAQTLKEVSISVIGEVEAERRAVQGLVPKRVDTRIDWLIDHGSRVSRGDVVLRWGTHRVQQNLLSHDQELAAHRLQGAARSNSPKS